MELNLELVRKHANVFGSPAYETTGVVYGTVKPGQYTVDTQFNSIKVDLGDGTFMSAALRGGVKGVDVDATKMSFTLEQFIAVKDVPANEKDGIMYSGITKGVKKDFATLVA